MEETIKNFARQFDYKPEIKNAEAFKKSDKYIVVGMGGSNLAAGLLNLWNPKLQITIHKNYGLPAFSTERLKESLVIASSYSGNTEEVVDALTRAMEQKLNVVTIATGGKLIELSEKHSLPYIQIPATPIQPRSALGFSFRALLKVIGSEKILKETEKLSETLKPLDFEERGKALAGKLKGFIPIIYSSTKNENIAYNWKIKFNETGKIPAFYNVFPELNHNEIAGFNVIESTKNLTQKFFFLFLKDSNDHPRIVKRMEILETLYRDRSLPVLTIGLKGENIFYRIFSSLILADWTAYYTAKQYDLEPAEVPTIEEFKKRIKD